MNVTNGISHSAFILWTSANGKVTRNRTMNRRMLML